MEILVVCGAGASSTFVVQRVRGALQRAGLAHTARAGAESALDGDLDDVGLVLVGPHLQASLEDIRTRITGAEVALLPPDVFGDLDGSRTLELILESLHLAPLHLTRPAGAPDERHTP
ncbi:PTS sugar transporter subunit IIB [Nesterenkonia xinjiangensis]|uniref:PTS system cellobiose-specific IIB component n=1 Tax=Nesterenkonia xinjiangensis TaxID=225327 RepID=A0A7Z0GLJ2_9MICC|nr:PTS sugar transporter [Nesterenkonia xinjiangensis]NYJ77371.1 PTS system cellobiose-specific IIB component [Nesterenkonia xinjiangensis]